MFQKIMGSVKTSSEDVGSVLSRSIPTCHPEDSLETFSKKLTEHSWNDMDYVFVLDDEKKILGMIDMGTVSRTDKSKTARVLMEEIKITLKENDKRQKALKYAVKFDADIIPVVDKDDRFIGAIISKTIIDLMHTEHLETLLITSGVSVKKHRAIQIVSAGVFEVFISRIPWLIMGLLVGLGLGLISSRFEESLQKNIALAYFIPVVAYIADSVGTQSEAIAIRSLATYKVNVSAYLFRELLVGILLGGTIGILGGAGAFIITGHSHIAYVVGTSLFMASAIAAILASSIPIIFKLLNKDPALASGPIATALQDIISVIIYFLFTLWLL